MNDILVAVTAFVCAAALSAGVTRIILSRRNKISLGWHTMIPALIIICVAAIIGCCIKLLI